MSGSNTKKILVTGGLGFIGSCFIEMALERGYDVVNVDVMTYATREDVPFNDHPNYKFIKADICDLRNLHGASQIINFAAESHVDNSIKSAGKFMKSNLIGVYHLLELVRKIEPAKRPLLVQISTDEVYGDILKGSFKETDRLKPSNPYSATKAAAEELIMGWGRTHGIRYRITRTSNNYGYGQRPEKLIPRTMKLARKGEKAKVYGKGDQRREWTYTEDNCEAIFLVMERGADGEIYNISSGEELTNLEVIQKVMRVMGRPENFYESVADRPGHDLRYAIDSSKIMDLGWKPKMTLDRYLPICRKQNEDRTSKLGPGKKRKVLRILGLEKLIYGEVPPKV